MSDITSRLSAALAHRYRIERRLGEGGMATVFLAEDLKHKRRVALKVLRAELAAVLGAERFVQEITTTASLQHPHILPLFDSGEADSFLYYVMPYVEGETLREKLDRETQLSIEESVKIATEVADALDYAHRHNVIHRDIKPENILLHDGRPMVADFGIALAVSAAAGGRMTETGLSLGTPHYMSPEQATADRDLTSRSDIYSLGTVLYEMLTGDPPHVGSSAQQIIMKIVTDEVRPLGELRKSVPPHVAAATSKSLEKLAADRFESAAKFAEALTNPAFTLPTTEVAAAVGGVRSGPQGRSAIAFAAVAALLAVAAAWGWLRPQSTAAPSLKLRLDFPSEQAVVSNVPALVQVGPQLALSPDGSVLVYSGSASEGRTQLWARRLSELDARPLAGTEGALYPSFSPSGDMVAFVTVDNRLRVVPIDGGPAVTVADTGFVWNNGLAWGADGQFYLTDGLAVVHVVAVSYSDGSVTRVTRPDSIRRGNGYGNPYALPDGKSLLVLWYPEANNQSEFRLSVADIETGEVSDLGVNAVSYFFVPPEYVAVVRPDGALLLIPFDKSTWEPTGPPIPVAEGIKVPSLGNAAVAASRSGTLLYQTGAELQIRLARVSRSGYVRDIDTLWNGGFWSLALSPNGNLLAATIDAPDGTTDIWIKDLRTGHLSQFTPGGGRSYRAAWHPDGESLAFLSEGATTADAYNRRADAGAAAELLVSDRHRIEEVEWSRDGVWLLYRTENEAGERRLMAIRPSVDSVGIQLSAPGSNAYTPALSPDGRLLAFVSDDGARRIEEVYVQPFPGPPEARVKVSTGGGRAPRWSHSGQELFYRNLDYQLIAVEVGEGPGITFGAREVLWGGAGFMIDGSGRGYDVAPGDDDFIVMRSVLREEGDIVLVTNLLEAMKAKVGN